MKLAKGSTPWISVPIFLTAALAAVGNWHISALALAGSIFMIFFHRDPDRFPQGDGMLSPADGKVIGLSKLARIVDYFSKGLQVQERITSKVADFIFSNFPVKGVEVTMEAEHLCMTIRGAKSVGSNTKTISSLGSLEDD